MFLLNISWSLLERDKWWRNSWRKFFPTFVESALLKHGLNQIMLCCRFVFVWLLLVLLNFHSKPVYPLSLRAFWYWHLDELKTSSLEEFLDKPSLIIFGNWLIICGGWFEDLLIYNNKSFGFLHGLYVSLFKLNVMSKKYSFKVGFYVDGEANIFKYFNNDIAHSIYLLTIYISQYEQFVINI